MSTVAPPMTTEEMLTLPDNGAQRELVLGELRETPMTKRNRNHSSAEARIAYLLGRWLDQHPQPGTRLSSGEAGFRLRRGPDTTVGIDVAFVSAEVVANSEGRFPYFEGPPILAVEILSPTDRQESIDEKIAVYRDANVPLIWIIDPVLKTVLVLRKDDEPVMFNVRQELSGEPELPGFLVLVAEIFRF